jgi:hypothetical protein
VCTRTYLWYQFLGSGTSYDHARIKTVSSPILSSKKKKLRCFQLTTPFEPANKVKTIKLYKKGNYEAVKKIMTKTYNKMNEELAANKMYEMFKQAYRVVFEEHIPRKIANIKKPFRYELRIRSNMVVKKAAN